MHGINENFSLQNESAIKDAKIDSRIIALMMNLGFPIGMPTIPVITIDDKINTIIF